MKREAGQGGFYFAVGAGDPAWDQNKPNRLETNRLAREIGRRRVADENILYLDENGRASRVMTHSLEIRAEIRAEDLQNTDPVREFGLFGGDATAESGSGFLINHVIHPPVRLDESGSFSCEIRLNLNAEALQNVKVTETVRSTLGELDIAELREITQTDEKVLREHEIHTIRTLAETGDFSAEARPRFLVLRAKARMVMNARLPEKIARALGKQTLAEALRMTPEDFEKEALSETAARRLQDELARLTIALEDGALETIRFDGLHRRETSFQVGSRPLDAKPELYRIMPQTTGALDDSSSPADADVTDEGLLNTAELEKKRRELDEAGWRSLRREQKEIYYRRLIMRAGLGREFQLPAGTPHFEFNAKDWQNPIQLESVAEFFMNFNDPRKPGSPEPGVNYPRLASDPTLIPVHLDSNPEKSTNVARHHARHAANVYPFRNCHLVLVDLFGCRLGGARGKVLEGDGSRRMITLEDSPALERLNPGFDTIRLEPVPESLKGQARYMNRSFVVAARTRRNILKLDRPLPAEFGSGPFRWNIPAGIGAAGPEVEYDIREYRPGRGFDHYDGVIFLVKDGRVLHWDRFSSFTSRSWNHAALAGMSLRGNHGYNFQSRRAKPSINYSFTITGPNGDASEYSKNPSRYYYLDPITDSGTWNIMLHYGSPGKVWNHSAGCVVSPWYYRLRDRMIEAYQEDYRRANQGREDPSIMELRGKDHNQSRRIRTRDIIPATDWQDKIWGRLWLIRPDEPPAGYSARAVGS